MGYAVAVLRVRETAAAPYSAERKDQVEDDRIEDLGDEIAVLAAQIHAATQRLLALIAEFDRLEGWSRTGFTDAHHVRHWADGGATSLGNCLLLCGHHHRLVHEGEWTVRWAADGRPVFVDPEGGFQVDGRWKPVTLMPDPVGTMIRGNAMRGVEPDGWTASARWEREADIPDAVYFRASENF